MYALLPILAILATGVNGAAIDRTGAELDKRAGCLLDPLGILGICGTGSGSGAASSSSSSASASKSSSASSSAGSSSSSSASASKSSSSSSAAATTSAASSSSSAAASSSASASKSSSASASSSSGNVVSSASAVVSSVSSVVFGVPSAVSSVLTVPSSAAAVVSSAASVVAAVPSSVSSIAAAAPSSAAAVVSSASSIVAAVPSAVSSAVVVTSSAAAIVSSASSIIAVVPSSASSIVAAAPSIASSQVAAVASSVSSIIAPASSSVVVIASSAAPASSSSSVVSSIIASVSAASSSASSAVASITTTSTSTTPSATPTPSNAAVSGWAYNSCIQEGTNGRALTAAANAGSSMTVESCLAFCDAGNYPLAGLEYSGECYCGSVLSNGASLTKTGTCAMTCSGNSLEICGGSATLSLYVSTKSNSAGLSKDLTAQSVSLPAGWSASASQCIQEVSGRALVEKSTASDDMTINKCLSFCGNYKYAGLEYGRECYCGNTLENGASFTQTSGQCNTPCAGASTNTCGGPNALQMYTNSNYKAASTGAWTNGGCAQEVSGRALRGASVAGSSMTIETCTSFCQSQGFTIAGLEYGQECYCDNAWQGGSSATNYSGQCNMPCAGNSAENCGGPNAINFYTVG